LAGLKASSKNLSEIIENSGAYKVTDQASFDEAKKKAENSPGFGTIKND